MCRYFFKPSFITKTSLWEYLQYFKEASISDIIFIGVGTFF